MRQRNSLTMSAVALTLATILVAAAVLDASAAPPRRGWRSTRYGRKGAEISAEFPRLTFPTGDGYSDELDVSDGLGFGFGLMWGISDNIAFEGRMQQTNHTAGSGEEKREWDIDIIKAGARFTFLDEYRLQPFLGAGWAKLALEHDPGSGMALEFDRLTGYGWYATIGVDYIHSGAWSFFFLADYTQGGYSHRNHGLVEESLDEILSGNCASVSIGIAYRVPAW